MAITTTINKERLKELMLTKGKPGPRYTSYPTAPVFQEISFKGALIKKFQADINMQAPLSLYVHIPFCQSLCWYCGCTTVITRNQNQADDYVRTVNEETRIRAQFVRPNRKVSQMHWGGGTPTFLTPDQIRRLWFNIRSHFNFADNAEVRVEIDPRTVTREHLKALKEVGFNQASIGVQDTDKKVQEAIHRIQPGEMNREVIDWLREFGFTSLNVDLIYGLPYQSEKQFRTTIEEVIEYNPDRIAVFNYAHVPWIKPAQKLLNADAMPPADEKALMVITIDEAFQKAGYQAIGLDHFARKDDELSIAQRNGGLWRNFQGYSTQKGVEMIGLGMSSISQADWGFYQNDKELPGYTTSIDKGELPVTKWYSLTEDDRIRGSVIMSIMCQMELIKADVESEFNISFDAYFEEENLALLESVKEGLVEMDDKKIEVTGYGKFLVRNIAMIFDAHLKHQNQVRFSKTV